MRKLFGHKPKGKPALARDSEVLIKFISTVNLESLTSSCLGDTKTIPTRACHDSFIPQVSDIWHRCSHYTNYRRRITITSRPTASHKCSISYAIFQLHTCRYITNSKRGPTTATKIGFSCESCSYSYNSSSNCYKCVYH
jgi:hypothetical protein